MQTRIHEAINNIQCSIDYYENNEDSLDPYYEIVGDLFTYNNERVTEVVINFIEKNSSVSINDLEKINKEFINDFIYTIATNNYYYKLVRNYDSYGCLYDGDLFGIDLGEQDIQVFNDGGSIDNNWIKNYIESKTNTVISGEYAYIILYHSITVKMNINECIELLNEEIENLQADVI